MKHTVFHAPECPLIELRCHAVSTPVDPTRSEHLTRRDNINSVPEDIADIKLIARSYAPTSRRDVRVSWTTWVESVPSTSDDFKKLSRSADSVPRQRLRRSCKYDQCLAQVEELTPKV